MLIMLHYLSYVSQIVSLPITKEEMKGVEMFIMMIYLVRVESCYTCIYGRAQSIMYRRANPYRNKLKNFDNLKSFL